jgi:galacturan 1,4-alpha-galacturonidase
MIIQDIIFKNFVGTSSAHYDPIVGTLVCSSAEVRNPDQSISITNNSKRCINIVAENITITTPSGKSAQWKCTNMNNGLLDLNCVA